MAAVPVSPVRSSPPVALDRFLSVTALSALARQQLVCAAADAAVPGRGLPVKVSGYDGSSGPEDCTV